MAECLITVRPHPLRWDRETHPIPQNTLDTMLEALPGGAHQLRVCIDGVPIPPDRWAWITPETNQVISAARVTSGSDSQSKNIGAIILGLTLVAGGLIPGPHSAFAISVGIGIALSGVTGLVTATPKTSTPDQAKVGPTRFGIQATSNVFEPYGPVPVTFGTIRTYPKMAAIPYTGIANGEQILHQIFIVRKGQTAISSIRIGETSIDNYQNVEYEILDGSQLVPTFTLYARDADEQGLNILLEQSSGWFVQTTGVSVDEISIDCTAQSGLGKQQSDGDIKGVVVGIAIEYAVAGSGGWIPIPNPVFRTRSIRKVEQTNPCKIGANNHHIVTGDIVSISGVQGMTQINGAGFTVVSHSKDAFQVNVDATMFSNYTGGGFVQAPRGIIFGGKSTTVVRKNKRWPVAKGSAYDVRVKRIHADSSKSNITDKIHWTALRTFASEAPVTEPNCAMIAVRIKASDQLNGVLQEVNCLATAKVNVWDGFSWFIEESNNPAWMYVEALTGLANDNPVSLDLMDTVALKTWADNCDTAGREFNYTLSSQINKRELLDMICTAGRASRTMNNGLYSVVEDKSQSVVRQHFSPRNSWDFQGQRFYPQLPHAVKAQFLDEAQDYKDETQIIYFPGYSESNATRFDDKVWQGLTNATQVWKETTFHIASIVTRPEIYTLKTDMENLVCTRGDLVRVSAPAALAGIAAVRIKVVTLSGTDVVSVDIDGKCLMQAGFSYGVQIRQADTVPIDQAIDLVVGEQTTLTFSTPIPDTEDQPVVGDLLLFGVASNISLNCIIQSIAHFDGTHATITLIDQADSIHSADSGTPPVWLPHITLPQNPQGQILPTPIIEAINSGANVQVRGPTGSFLARMSVQARIPSGTFGIIAYLQARIRLQDPEEDIEGPWTLSPYSAASTGEVLIDFVKFEQIYDVQVRAVNGVGVTSDWSALQTHIVAPQALFPPDVDVFLINTDADGTRRFTWVINLFPPDFKGVQIRYKSGTGHVWEDMTELHTGFLLASPFETNQLVAGTYTFAIKMFNNEGHESENEKIIQGTLSDPRLGNSLIQINVRALGWPGTKTSCTVEQATGVLYAIDDTTTWQDFVDDSVVWGA